MKILGNPLAIVCCFLIQTYASTPPSSALYITVNRSIHTRFYVLNKFKNTIGMIQCDIQNANVQNKYKG